MTDERDESPAPDATQPDEAQVRGSAPEPEAQPQPGKAADLLSIGLLVFFVALLVVVAALLALPIVLG